MERSECRTRGHQRTPDRVAPSRDPGSSTKTGRAAALYFFKKNWIPDRRGGFAAACPGYEPADVIYAKDVIYAGVRNR
jgi:hypothetical protein